MTVPIFRSIAWRIVLVMTGVASVAWFFRFHILSGFARFSGDSYDAMIEVSILQHWQNVFAGQETWNSLAYFQPARNSLGYNDGYFLYGVIYTIARSVGLPLIAAAECVNVVMKLIGFFGMYAFLARTATKRSSLALFGAVLFTIADITLIHVNHAQLLTIALAPVGALLAWNAMVALYAGDSRGLLRNGLAFALLFATWISTAYYPAWFFGFFLLLMVATYLAASRENRRRLFDAVNHARWTLATVGASQLLLLIPFLIVYGSKAVETGSRGFSGVRRTTITPIGLFNPGAANGIWSHVYAFVTALFPQATPQDAVFSVAPILLVVAVIALVRAVQSREPMNEWRLVAVVLGVSWLLVMRIGPVTPWYAVHLIVPGASALRVIGRFQLILLLPCIALAVRALDGIKTRGAAALLAVALFAEQAAGTSAPVKLDQSAQLAMIAGTPAPPLACRYFVVRSARPYPYPVQDPVNDRFYANNVDAMVLAEMYRLPMLNGFSSFNPPGWDFADPVRADFPQRAQTYAARFGLRDVCLLDREHADAWIPLPPR